MSKHYTSVLQWGNNILYRGIENGRKVQEKVPFSPTLFIDAKGEASHKTLWGNPTAPVHFSDIKEAKEFVKRYEDVEGFNFYGMTQYQYQFIAEEFPGEIQYNINDLTIVGLDIETASENGFPDPDTALEEVLLISVQNKTTKELIVWGARDYNGKTKLEFAGEEFAFEYKQCKDERHLLLGFLNYWEINYPHIITGWNIDGYDIPYLVNRIRRVLGEEYVKRLSPWGNVSSKEVLGKHGKEQTEWDLQGIVALDYFDLYQKFSYNQRESYALGFICEEELGETKLDFEGSFKDAYTNQWDLFVEYNARDTQLVLKLDDKLRFIELACTIAYLAKCNIRDVFGPVKTWDVFIYNYLRAKNIVIPQFRPRKTDGIEGAYVKEPKPGLYGWNLSFDFASLYPTIIRQWNMSPETYTHDSSCGDLTQDQLVNPNKRALECFAYAKDKGYTIAANGTMYRKDKMGIIPEVLKVTTDGRKIAKKRMLELEQEYEKTKNPNLLNQIASYDGKQMALKILSNALYGALGNAGFRYTNRDIAEAITLTGQAANKHSSKHLNNYMNKALKTEGVDYVIYADTDSAYVDVDPIVKLAWKDKTEKEIVAAISKLGKILQDGPAAESNREMFEQCNCFELLMDLKREAISSKGLWTAKKRYALKVHNSEGVDYAEPKLKIKGLDLVKTSTPKAIRDKLKKVLNVIFEHDEEYLQKYVEQYKAEFFKMPVEDVAFPRSVNDIDKWKDDKIKYKSGTPIAVRSAILFNELNEKLGDYPAIKNGDKVKFVYLKMPNKMREDVIGFPSHGKLPVAFGLHGIIDKDKQWEKVFINPLKGLTDAIGWQVEKQASLEGVLF